MTSTTLLRRSHQPAARSAGQRLPHRTVAVMGVVLAGCLLAGAYAAIAGGALSRFGDGPGGLAGLPQLALLAIAVLLGVPSAFLSRTRPARALLVLVGPLAVAFGYFFFTHAVDPCASGLVDSTATVRGAPLCATTGGYLEIDTRFHLLEHAVAGGLLLAAYGALLRRVDARR
jgi:hypothetical protein